MALLRACERVSTIFTTNQQNLRDTVLFIIWPNHLSPFMFLLIVFFWVWLLLLFIYLHDFLGGEHKLLA